GPGPGPGAAALGPAAHGTGGGTAPSAGPGQGLGDAACSGSAAEDVLKRSAAAGACRAEDFQKPLGDHPLLDLLAPRGRVAVRLLALFALGALLVLRFLLFLALRRRLRAHRLGLGSIGGDDHPREAVGKLVERKLVLL